ncbi:lipopolysaccharide biosynthesis protein [Paraburkholderia sediminicola]|uniref:lipopolysaccharide biosynthesis protein n=1 Tax=Paraburkholderia sediminicola TaxID=458836 RepID=UPI0038BD86A3
MNIKHSFVSVVGVVLSQALNFVSILLIGKYCGPTDLGYFSQLTASGLFIGSVIGLRLEVACMASEKGLAVRAMVSSSVIALAIGLALVVAAMLGGRQEYAPAIALALGVFLQQALCAALTSERKYTKIATIRFFPNAAFAVYFVCLMAFSKKECTGSNVFNIYSWIFLTSTLVPAAIYIFRSRGLIQTRFMSLSAIQIQYAKFGLPTTTLNSFVIYASAIVMPLIFDHRDAGIFALAYRVGYFPASLLSQSLGAVFRRDLIDFFDGKGRGGEQNPSRTFFVMLTFISVALVAACYAGLSLIITLKMGDQWKPSMSVYFILVPYFLAMAIYGSMAQIFIVLNQQKIDLVIQTTNAALIFLVFATAHFLKVGFMETVSLLSISGAIVASIGTYQAIRIGKGPDERRILAGGPNEGASDVSA